MASLSQWVQGARPRTLPAALAPVAAGTGAAAWQLEGLHGDVDWALVIPRALLALAVSFSLQIGVNFANDYSDGIRGTDDDRVGPFRLTGSGAARPATVKRAAIVSLALGGLFGLVLIAIAQIWWTLVVGAAAIAAAWFYTGGRSPTATWGSASCSCSCSSGWWPSTARPTPSPAHPAGWRCRPRSRSVCWPSP